MEKSKKSANTDVSKELVKKIVSASFMGTPFRKYDTLWYLINKRHGS